LDKYEYKIKRDSVTLKRAQHHFQKALELDSTFALAYTGLAAVQNWNLVKNYLFENYMDSVLILANKAITFDDKCSEAYTLKGSGYVSLAKPELALKELNKALELYPNNSIAFYIRGSIYREIKDDYVEAIRNLINVLVVTGGKDFRKYLMILAIRFGWLDLINRQNIIIRKN
jgi:tetratricopeptide (TPR) repeat protein